MATQTSNPVAWESEAGHWPLKINLGCIVISKQSEVYSESLSRKTQGLLMCYSCLDKEAFSLGSREENYETQEKATHKSQKSSQTSKILKALP